MNINKETFKLPKGSLTKSDYLKGYRKTAKWKEYYKSWLEKNKGYHKNYYQNLKNKAKQYDETKQGNQQDDN